MITIRSTNINGAWIDALDLLKNEGKRQESRFQDTVELLHVGLEISDPRQNIVFARNINPAFAVIEVIATLAGSNDVSFLKVWNKRMNDYTDSGKDYFHGAYGYRLGSNPGIRPDIAKKLRHENAPGAISLDQLKQTLLVLQQANHSRQAVLQYWNAVCDLPNPDPVSNDVPCNLASHLMIRNGKFEWLQVMRSNDMIWGLPYDCIQFTTLQEIMAGWLNVEIGTYNHISDSLHVYERHFDYFKKEFPRTAVPINRMDLRVGPYEKWQELFREVVDIAHVLSEKETENEILDLLKRSVNLTQAYSQWIYLLAAERLRLIKSNETALEIIKGSGEYWEKSWLQWFEYKKEK